MLCEQIRCQKWQTFIQRSDANIATLRALLKDEGTVRSTRNGRDVDLYLVRIRAFEALTSMGVRVDRPVEYRGGG